jgi:hypothetical protein
MMRRQQKSRCFGDLAAVRASAAGDEDEFMGSLHDLFKIVRQGCLRDEQEANTIRFTSWLPLNTILKEGFESKIRPKSVKPWIHAQTVICETS